MPDPLSNIGLIADAIKEGFKFLGQVMSGAESRRLKYRIEAAVNYVHVDEKIGEYKGITDKKQKELKIHFSKRIFDES